MLDRWESLSAHGPPYTRRPHFQQQSAMLHGQDVGTSSPRTACIFFVELMFVYVALVLDGMHYQGSWHCQVFKGPVCKGQTECPRIF